LALVIGFLLDSEGNDAHSSNTCSALARPKFREKLDLGFVHWLLSLVPYSILLRLGSMSEPLRRLASLGGLRRSAHCTTDDGVFRYGVAAVSP
jgi:hypothetical protein